MSFFQKRDILYGSIVHVSKFLKVNKIDSLTSNCIEIGGCAKSVKINGDLIVTGDNCSNCLQTNDPDVNVHISGSNPPNAGQILVATSSTNAVWANGGGGSSGNIAYQLSSIENKTISVNYTSIAYFTWYNSLYNTYTSPLIIFEIEIPVGGNTLDLRVRGQNTGTLLELTGLNTSQFISNALNTLPINNDRIIIEIRSSNGLIAQPKIFGLTLQFTQ